MNLEVVYQEFYGAGFLEGQLRLYAEGDMLVVQSVPELGNREGSVYDLGMPRGQWFLGTYFKMCARADSCDWLMLPKLGLIFFYSYYMS